jgi:hypothetical protein
MMSPHALTPGLHQTLETLPPFECLYDRYLSVHLGNEQDAANVLDEVLEPARLSLVAALLQAYTVPLPAAPVHDIRQALLKHVHPVSS